MEHKNAALLESEDLTPLASDRPSGGAASDWSSLMTEVLRSLDLAEEDLRLIHMDESFQDKARTHLWRAQAYLLLLDQWCRNKGELNGQ